LLAILLAIISGYFINGYWWLFFVIFNYIMTIGGYYRLYFHRLLLIVLDYFTLDHYIIF
jgi:hypothetical protein